MAFAAVAMEILLIKMTYASMVAMKFADVIVLKRR